MFERHRPTQGDSEKRAKIAKRSHYNIELFDYTPLLAKNVGTQKGNLVVQRANIQQSICPVVPRVNATTGMPRVNATTGQTTPASGVESSTTGTAGGNGCGMEENGSAMECVQNTEDLSEALVALAQFASIPLHMRTDISLDGDLPLPDFIPL